MEAKPDRESVFVTGLDYTITDQDLKGKLLRNLFNHNSRFFQNNRYS